MNTNIGHLPAGRAASILAGCRAPDLHVGRDERREMADKKKWVTSAYGEKLRDPRWQKRRLEVMSRDEFTCQHCFDTASTLHVHHRWYLSGAEPWDYDLDALITLCEACHESETISIREQADDLILILKRCGAMAQELEQLFSVFHASIKTPLNGYEWHVLTRAIWQLLHDRSERAGSWLLALEEERRLTNSSTSGE